MSPEESVTTVTLRSDTLEEEVAVREWLDEHERKLTEAVREGRVIVE